jgi:hypothetical protein
LFVISTQKKKGTVTWKNLVKERKILYNTDLTFVEGFGLFFADKWHFMIKATSTKAKPVNSLVVVDILLNNKETTATCEIVSCSSTSTKFLNISCISDSEALTKNDIVKISKTKKSGTIEWNLSEDKEISAPVEKSLSLSFIDAYDMHFNKNKWAFTVKGKATADQSIGEKYIIDIHYYSYNKQHIDSTASCMMKEGARAKVIFFCVCDYDDQNEKDLVMISSYKTDSSTITWSTGFSEEYYKIATNASLTLVKAYGLTYQTTWRFYLDYTDAVLPVDAKIIIGILSTGPPKTCNCTTVSDNSIFCITTETTNSKLISLNPTKSEDSSIEWKNNLQGDYRIIINLQLSFVMGYDLIFNETDSKWYFRVKVTSGKIDTKVVIDILYGDKSSTATCITSNSTTLNCVVNEENQNKLTLIRIKPFQSLESSVSWSNIDKEQSITLLTDLTFVKVNNLRLNSSDNTTWLFDIYVSDDDIPQNSKIIVEIFGFYSYGNKEETKSYLADCIYSNGKMSCEADKSLKEYKYSISLKTTRNENCLSSVLSWNNVNGEESLPIPLTYRLQYGHCTDAKKEYGKYIFYCGVLPAYKIPKNSISIVGIKIDGQIKTSQCIALNHTFLKCEIKNEDYTSNNNIYILKDKTEDATITWHNDLLDDQYLFPFTLDFIYAYDGYQYYQGEYSTLYKFKILARGEKLIDKKRFGVKVLHKIRYKTNSPDKILEVDIPACELLNGVIYCLWYCEAYRISTLYDDFSLMLTNNGDSPLWTTNGYKSIDQQETFYLNFNKLNSFIYNYEKGWYEISLDVNGDHYSTSSLVIDIKVGGKPSWLYCIPNSSNKNNIACSSQSFDFNPEPEIKISYNINMGNVYWNNLNSDKELPFNNDKIVIEISKIFDLQFDSSKWKFKIKPIEMPELDEAKSLSVVINEENGLANCIINGNLLECEVDSSNQVNTQLIKLNKNYYSSDIVIKKMDSQGIPLKASLEYVKAYDLEYDNQEKKWTFFINAKVNSGTTIPNGSTFSTDIKIITSGSSNNDLAFCTQSGEIKSNIITLLCKPQNTVQQNQLISLNKDKSDYSSITWTNTINEENIFISAELNVKKVDQLNYNSGKWSFEMTLYSASSFPLNSKILIDLLYNNEETTATCTLTRSNRYLCSPNKETQQVSDSLSISTTKKLGTVTYTNTDNLMFPINAQFIKAYDLKMNSENKWEFKISISTESLQNGQTLIVDVKIDNNYSTANCIYSTDILSCVINYNPQNIRNEIKLRNNRERTYLIWSGLSNELDMYMAYDIKFINVYGGFHENKWKFNIYHEPINKLRSYDNVKVLIDVKVNNQQSTALCQILNTIFMNCVSNRNYHDEFDVLKIIGNSSPNLGTVSFVPNLNGEIQIKPISLYIDFESCQSYRNKNNNLEFSITGRLAEGISYEIGDETITKMDILITEDDDRALTDAICLTNNIKTLKTSYVYLSCIVEETILANDKYSIYINDDGYSGYVKFSSIENIELDTSKTGGTTKGKGNNPNNGSGQTYNILSYLNIILLLALIL